MKSISIQKMSEIKGGDNYSNRTCSRLGGVAFLAAVGQQWAATLGITAAAAAGGCFDYW
ncbi:hypothetical protein [Echinicola vietnamensis]|uniref:Uncharacterized protein n=1 Tax=Echinicola vietnamensis (strain DSM 17526 / LMG 23754 / KMM 6221) TaxID=926556 RepID=L0FZP8_ECHVK|nr:hypothetical protein [Echinicola vietnamensis]AGA78493.1 hypothetical protein Echvi_2245 [Echinicola vietnamensis DSM 17526]